MKWILQSRDNVNSELIYKFYESQGIESEDLEDLPLFWRGIEFKIQTMTGENIEALEECLEDCQKFLIKKLKSRHRIYGVYAGKRFGNWYLLVAWSYFRRKNS